MIRVSLSKCAKCKWQGVPIADRCPICKGETTKETWEVDYVPPALCPSCRRKAHESGSCPHVQPLKSETHPGTVHPMTHSLIDTFAEHGAQGNVFGAAVSDDNTAEVFVREDFDTSDLPSEVDGITLTYTPLSVSEMVERARQIAEEHPDAQNLTDEATRAAFGGEDDENEDAA